MLTQDMEDFYSEGNIRLGIDNVKSWPSVGDKRPYINGALDCLADMERRILKYVYRPQHNFLKLINSECIGN